jgi:hypothetical protein
MKKEKTTIYKNGIEVRRHNTRVSMIESEGEIKFKFEKFIGQEIITSITENERGIATTYIKIGEDTFKQMISGWIEYYLRLKNDPDV